MKIHASGKPTPSPIFAPDDSPDFAVLLLVAEADFDVLLLVTETEVGGVLVVESGISPKFHPLT
jgi:hypothetical protein